MRIIYGITKSNFGGAQSYVFELAREAKRQGHDVKVISGGQGVLTEKLKEAEVENIPLLALGRDVKILSDIKSGIGLMKILNRERPSVFHINSTKMGGVGAFAARLVGIKKIIFTSHGWAFNETWRPTWQKVLIKLFAWLTVLLSHTTICVSEKTKRDIENLPFIKHKLHVVRNGISEFELLGREEARRELGIADSQALQIGTIGELHKVKGHDVLLRAWQKFVQGRNAQLTIISDGDEKENLNKLAKDLGVENSVKFAGFIPDARKLLKAFDMYVFPSRSENLPYAVLEAGYASLPVIASSVGGIPEIIETGVNGILVEKENAEELLSSLTLLHDNPRMRDRLGIELKKTVSEKFTFEKMTEETFSLY